MAVTDANLDAALEFWRDAGGIRQRMTEAGPLETERIHVPVALSHLGLYGRIVDAVARGAKLDEAKVAELRALHARYSVSVQAAMRWWASR